MNSSYDQVSRNLCVTMKHVFLTKIHAFEVCHILCFSYHTINSLAYMQFFRREIRRRIVCPYIIWLSHQQFLNMFIIKCSIHAWIVILDTSHYMKIENNNGHIRISGIRAFKHPLRSLNTFISDHDLRSHLEKLKWMMA